MIARNAAPFGDIKAVECVPDYRRNVRIIDFTRQTEPVEATVSPLAGYVRCHCDFLRIAKLVFSPLQTFVGFTVGKIYSLNRLNILGTFAYSRKAPVCPSVSTYQRSYHWTECYEI